MASKNESFEKLYERALSAARARGALATQPVLDWSKSRQDPEHTMTTKGLEFRANAWRGGFAIIHMYSGKIVDIDNLTSESLLHAEYKARKTPPPAGDDAKNRKRY